MYIHYMIRPPGVKTPTRSTTTTASGRRSQFSYGQSAY